MTLDVGITIRSVLERQREHHRGHLIGCHQRCRVPPQRTAGAVAGERRVILNLS